MKNREALVERLRAFRDKKAEIKRIEKALADARAALPVLEDELTNEWWDNGGLLAQAGAQIYLFFAFGEPLGKPELSTYTITLKTRSNNDLFRITDLFTFNLCSEVGKKLRRFRTEGSGLFRFLVKRGLVPKWLKLVCVGGHFYEKKGGKWVEIK